MTNLEKLAAYLSVLRFDHWIKNLFFLPGFVFALYLSRLPLSSAIIGRALLGLLALGLVASVNYTINEIVDAPFDRFHPTKKYRAIPAQKVRIPVLYLVAGLFLIAAGVLAYRFLPLLFLVALGLFFISGLVYNLPPVRLKDVAIFDVLTESINNPIRFAAGWFIIRPDSPPLVYLITFWALGAFWMAGKRYGEFGYFKNQEQTLRLYRKSFQSYSEQRLRGLLSAAVGVFFIGYTIISFSLEPRLIAAIPFVLVYFWWYGRMIFGGNELAREPENIMRHSGFAAYNIFLAILFLVILFVL